MLLQNADDLLFAKPTALHALVLAMGQSELQAGLGQRGNVTFAEVRRHLGVETQRQWSDPAIARTTPALLGLFSLIALWAQHLYGETVPPPRSATWYSKPLPTFSDALALVRRELWVNQDFRISATTAEVIQIPQTTFNPLIGAACYAA